MKKSLILLGVLSIGYAHAQEERVGINTENPSATLNIKTKTDTKTPKNLELENQSGKKLMTVLNNGKVGIGTENPTYKLELVAQDNSYYENSISIKSFREGGNSSIDIRKARGNNDAPSTLKKGDNIASWVSAGYNGNNYITGAVINTSVTGDITEGQVPTSIHFTVRNPELTSFNASNANGGVNVMTVHHSNKVGIGTTAPTEKLHIAGAQNKVKIENLSGTGDRPVYADANGVLKVGAAGNATLKATDTTEQCTADKAGTIHYKEIAITGTTDKKKGIFGFCTKNANGDAVWVYMNAGSNITNGTGTFGQGL